MQQLNAQIGGRIKRMRRQRKVSQSALADALGISPSYLNLIEHNRRRVTVPLLFKTASYFGVEPGELAESEEPRLAGDLMELFGDDLFADSDLTNQDISDLATSNPAVGRAVLRLYDRFRALGAGGLPATAQIEAGDSVTTDAVSDFLQANANHFSILEAAAERIRADIDHASDSFEHGLRTYLHNVFGLQWRLASLPAGMTRKVDAARGEILTADLLPAETAAFTVAQHLGRLGAGDAIQQLITEASLPEEAEPIARNALTAYFAAALMMPYEPFLMACKETRYDIERIGRRFRASFEQVCHRMTTLQRPGRTGVPLHLVRTDIAGNISKRFSLSGIYIPRHSGACPRWNVYGAFLHPERINVQISQMPDGQRFFCIAKAVTKGGYQHNEPKRHLSIGLGCHIAHASELVYSDGVDISNMERAVAIGVGCRICPRTGCAQRAYPAAGHRMNFDESARSENFYASS